VILDVEGDDESGPINLLVKLFPADRPEPIYHLGAFTLAAGLHSDPDPNLDHAFLAAALGPNTSSMEISDFSICAIPRDQKYVRFLTCSREDDGTILVRWPNTPDAAD